ncbi:hypothetical protein GCM10028793_59480 [Nocardiopsis oceani]
MVDPLALAGVFVEVGGDPGDPVGGVAALFGVLQDMDLLGQGQVRALACRPGGGGLEPGVERGPGQADDLAQPLHLEGVSVVGNELEAVQEPSINYCLI